MTYTPTFYEQIRAGVQASAEVVVPHVLGHLTRSPRWILDVGCGEGWWARQFGKEAEAVTVVGIDGLYVDPIALEPAQFRVVDLDEELPHTISALTRFDLVICLEVAEHLAPERAESFVADLCRLGETVLFSAAIPGQGGVGHRNERWQSYWAALFEAHRYEVSASLRPGIWDDERVEPWYRQNLLIASQRDAVWGVLPDEPPMDVVHPVIYGWRLAELGR